MVVSFGSIEVSMVDVHWLKTHHICCGSDLELGEYDYIFNYLNF